MIFQDGTQTLELRRSHSSITVQPMTARLEARTTDTMWSDGLGEAWRLQRSWLAGEAETDEMKLQ